jgi:hypothetical protein
VRVATPIGSEKMMMATPIESEKMMTATPIEDETSYTYRMRIATPIE